MSGLGATPAAAATPPGQVYQTITQTGWIPIMCNLDGNLAGNLGAPHGNFPIHIGVALQATMPGAVTPGQKFALTKVTSYQIQPGTAQFAANAFNADMVAGVVNDFENNLTGAVGWNGSTQFNQIAGLQAGNPAAPNPVDNLVDPNSSNPAPGVWWGNTPASDPRRSGVFSFGPIPIDTNGGSGVPTSFGPTPGTGGGHAVPYSNGNGIPDPINVYPYTVTGAAGTDVVLSPGGPAPNPLVHLNDTSPDGRLVAQSNVFFHNIATATWYAPAVGINGFGFYAPTPCGIDTGSFQVPPDAPGYCTTPPTLANPAGVPAGCFVGNSVGTGGFHIPIVAPPGLLRITQSTAPTPGGAVATQISIDGNIADTWGTNWVKTAPGSHTVCFTHVEGWTESPCQTVTVTSGNTTVVTNALQQRGFVHVFTNPAVAGQIKFDGNPTDNWGMFTDVPTGAHQVCFGPVANFLPPSPACQNITITAGALTNVQGNYTSSAGAPGNTGVGFLRVTQGPSPALATQITIQAGAGTPYIADTWGTNWVELPPGSYTVRFAHIEGWIEPAPSTVTVTNGATTVVTGNFIQRGFLHAVTSPAVAGTVLVDDIARDDWGVFTDMPVGSHTVCFGPAPTFYHAPPCQAVTITAGALTNASGTYPY